MLFEPDERRAVLHLLALPALQAQVGDPNRFNTYLIGGYAVMSALCLGYMLYLYLRQRNLQHDIALLQQLLQEKRS